MASSTSDLVSAIQENPAVMLEACSGLSDDMQLEVFNKLKKQLNYGNCLALDRIDSTLQSHMLGQPSGRVVKPSDDSHVMVIIPSLSSDPEELKKIEGVQHYEERQLFHILRLRDESLTLILITSLPLHPSVVNYYLTLVQSKTVDRRFILFSTFDASMQPLSQKILDRPILQNKIRRAIVRALEGSAPEDVTAEDVLKYGSRARTVCFIPSTLEYKLANTFGCEILCSPEDTQFWGTKTGSRQLFRDSEVPHPIGVYDSIYSAQDLALQLAELWESKPAMTRVVVKLNEGFSGEGNALLDMGPVISRLYANYKFLSKRQHKVTKEERVESIKHELQKMRFQAANENWESFEKKIHRLGCIVEQYVEGQGKQSPSVQAMIHEDGRVEILSSHEQVLGGPDGQVYLGCHFPCDPAYRVQLHEYTLKVGKLLSKHGARDRFGIDYLCVPEKPWDFEQWNVFALEINLRSGGTTHPYETLRQLTNGKYQFDSGIYVSEQGQEKYYIATDNLQEQEYKGLLPSDLMRIIKRRGIEFDPETQTGVVFHLMGALSEFGKLGVTCIGNTVEGAHEIYQKTWSTVRGVNYA
eukprot:CAMPEP_0114617326 /NCGR_PEP_ID=MMETSP0168-20121206/7141_1 /TAXON_ID=95228 ORGANISM="Vannella sp., Strain DIVA3 517/6/12" /NCGR_SAMPLE_ID=MMETSP0168 /ASSEMBLY_ACC=CAM_ASM_000044 /LENGTH=582 /DNA_ID=CAMNT_0001828461 /DNA_START=51 /DNA_END=1799 /DNA_ORIENTATION=-